jgi:glycosyltransferase involved in cell wall biosynthesis
VSLPDVPMTVTFCLYSDTLGGAETHTCALAALLRNRGWDVRLVFLVGPGRELTSMLQAQGVEVRLLEYGAARDTLTRPGRLVASMTSGGLPLAVLPSNGFLPVSLFVGRFRGVVVAMEHGDALNRHLLAPWRRMCDWWSRRLGALLVDCEVAVSSRRLGALLVDCEVAVSRTSARNLSALPHARSVAVIPNGVDVGRFVAPRERPPGDRIAGNVTVGVAARLVRGKGLDTLMEACRVAAGELGESAWRVLIAGEGPESGHLRASRSRLGLEGVVEFVGWAKDMPGFWGGVDVGVFPSDSWIESFGLSSVEAAACGCRCLISDSEASREVFDGSSIATFFHRGDPHDLARRLIEAVRGGQPTSLERREGHAWVAHRYSLGRAADAYASLFCELSRERSGRRVDAARHST